VDQELATQQAKNAEEHAGVLLKESSGFAMAWASNGLVHPVHQELSTQQAKNAEEHAGVLLKEATTLRGHLHSETGVDSSLQVAGGNP
jgi:hypothetical protein